MKNFIQASSRPFAAFLIIILFVTSCFEDRDDNLSPVSTTLEIKDFVWKAMNVVYLYKDEIPDLDDDRFSSDEEYRNYLESFSTPEQLFESLLFMPEVVDKFSFITDDYIALEQAFSGITKRSGIEMNFYFEPGSNTEVFAIIRLVLNNSNADNAGLERGMIITGINGTELNANNFNSLFANDMYTVNLGDYNDNGTSEVNDDTIFSNGESVTLTKEIYTENPVHLFDIIEVDGISVGYLVFNGFTEGYDDELNEVFGFFKSNNIDELVLDLRYNPGGKIFMAQFLGSMITGQFEGQVFSKLVYNQTLQELNTEFKFVNTISNDAQINSLGLDKVYIITTDDSASASELVINSLDEYIDVIQVGMATRGKTQASFTVYDSPNLGRADANPNHTYALQPLVANSINKNGTAVPANGLVPDISINETPVDFKMLGDPEERLLAAALAEITGNSRFRNRIDTDFDNLPTEFNLSQFEGGLIFNLPSFSSNIELRDE